MSNSRWWIGLLLLYAGCAGGTETGNPPTRGDGGAGACGVCAPPITLEVTDATQAAPIAGLTVDGDDMVCKLRERFTECTLRAAEYATPGTHVLFVTAPGYEPQVVDVRVQARSEQLCSGCSHVPTRAGVKLVPAAE